MDQPPKSLRDEFAAAAITGLLASPSAELDPQYDESRAALAKMAFAIADEMLKLRA